MKRILYLIAFLPLFCFGQGQVIQQSPVASSGGNYNHQWFSWSNGAFINTLSVPSGTNATLNNSLPREGSIFIRWADSTLQAWHGNQFVPVGKGGSASSSIYINALQFKNNGSVITAPLSLQTDTQKSSKIYYLGFVPGTKALRYDTTQFGSGGGSTGINGLNGTANIGLGGTLSQSTYIHNSIYPLSSDSLNAKVKLHAGTVVMPGAPGGNLIVFGASIEVGTGSSGGTPYITLLGKYLGYYVTNHAVSGSTWEKRSPLNPLGGTNLIDQISLISAPATTRDILLIGCMGINDFQYAGANYTPTNAQTDLTTFVTACISAGWNPSQILIFSTSYYNPANYGTTGAGGGTRTLANQLLFNTIAQNVATAKSTLFFDMFNYIKYRGGVNDLSDGLHPNALGHYLMAQGAFNFLRPTYYDTGQTFVSNGISALSNLNYNRKIVVQDSISSLMGIDTAGNVGIIKVLPDSTRFLNSAFLGGSFQEVGATLPNSGFGNTDFLVNQGSSFWGVFSGNGSIASSWTPINNLGQMNFATTYSGGDINFLTHSTLALTINRSQSLTVATGVDLEGVAGNIYVPQGTTGLKASTGSIEGAFDPLETSNFTSIFNTHSAGGLKIYQSNGVNTGKVEMFRMFNDGHTTFQNGGTFTEDASAILSLKSTSFGFLPPAMTTTQKNAISSPATGLEVYDLTVGALSVYSGSAWVNLGAGTGSVTSVGLSMPSIFSVSGSPVTTSGTLTATLANESANTIFSGPTSGGAAAPTFRSMVNADLPTSAVTPGSYTSANITVNAQGIVTSASNGSGGGAVSSVSNSDGTLTISPTTGAVVGSINLAHSNTWTGLPIVSLTDNSSSGNGHYGLELTNTLNQTSTAGFTDLLINRTETAAGSGNQRFYDFQVGGTSRYYLDHNGYTNVTPASSTVGNVFNVHMNNESSSWFVFYNNAFSSSSSEFSFTGYNNGNIQMGNDGNHDFQFYTNSYLNNRMTIKNSGEIIVGNGSSIVGSGYSMQVQGQGTSATGGLYVSRDVAINVTARENSAVITAAGSEALDPVQTTVSGSTSGTIVGSEPFVGANYKRVVVYLSSLVGTATYTFPTAFTNTPQIVLTNGPASGIITTLNVTSATFTGTTTSGFMILEGY